MGNFHQKPNLYIGEVGIKVSDLQRSIQFYEEIIGLKVLQKNGNTASLTADGKKALLILEQPENVVGKQKRTAGLYHFAILLPSRANLSVFLRHLVQTGYPLGAGDHYVSEALYLDDPDGNGIEVYSDRPSKEWEWNNGLVNMATVQLDAKGILAESQAPWKGLPSGTVMGHIHLHVSDLKKAEEFYTKGIGYETVSQIPQALFMSTGKYHHHVAINTWAGIGAPSTPKNSVGLNWFTVYFPNETKREQAVERIKELGREVHKENNEYVTSDPSDNQIRMVIS